MSLDFGQPDEATHNETSEVSAQKAPKPEQKAPKGTASSGASNDAYDLSSYITQSREKASTGERQELQPDEFTDEDLLSEAGYNEEGKYTGTPIEEVEAEEVDTEPLEISDEWLDIFAWAGVELTDEAVPQMLKWLHAEDDHHRFKLPPTRRDKLQIAWKVFLRKVLPAWDEKEGLLAIIFMLYIENIVTGVWKAFGRVMSGTFTWPQVWPFTIFSKKKEVEPEPEETPSPFQPQPQPVSADVENLADQAPQPAPSVVKQEKTLAFDLPKKQAEPAPAPKKEAQVIELPPAPDPEIKGPQPIEQPGGKRQDPMTHNVFKKEDGQPKKPWFRESKKNGKQYRVQPFTFENNSSFQKWLHGIGFYKTNSELDNE